MEDKAINDVEKGILDFCCPRFNQLPQVALYKDQVITYIEGVLKPINFNSQEKLLTPTMVNNYVKQKVVAPPKDKKYDDTHIAYLIVVCVLKQVFSLTEVCDLMRLQMETYPIGEAYDYFCTELENSLKAVFTTRNFSEGSAAIKVTKESEIVRSAVLSFVHKIYIENYFNSCKASQ